MSVTKAKKKNGTDPSKSPEKVPSTKKLTDSVPEWSTVTKLPPTGVSVMGKKECLRAANCGETSILNSLGWVGNQLLTNRNLSPAAVAAACNVDGAR